MATLPQIYAQGTCATGSLPNHPSRTRPKPTTIINFADPPRGGGYSLGHLHLSRIPYICREASIFVESALQISIFYAKQTQSQKDQNQRNLLYHKELRQYLAPPHPKEQTQSNPNPSLPKPPKHPSCPQSKPNPSAAHSFVSPFAHRPIESSPKTEFHKISIENNLQPAPNKTHTHAARRAFIPCLDGNLEYNVGTQYPAVSRNKWILQFRRHRTWRTFGAKSRGGIRRAV